jgi:hypothetical protein
VIFIEIKDLSNLKRAAERFLPDFEMDLTVNPVERVAALDQKPGNGSSKTGWIARHLLSLIFFNFL